MHKKVTNFPINGFCDDTTVMWISQNKAHYWEGHKVLVLRSSGSNLCVNYRKDPGKCCHIRSKLKFFGDLSFGGGAKGCHIDWFSLHVFFIEVMQLLQYLFLIYWMFNRIWSKVFTSELRLKLLEKNKSYIYLNIKL